MRGDQDGSDLILVVDEEPAGLLALQEMLQGRGYVVVTALTGAAARQIVEKRGPEIQAVVLELALPDVSGFELLQWIKAEPSVCQVEVIVQSTRLDTQNVRKALDLGAYFYLSRPFQPPQVRAIVKAAVSACRLRRSLAQQIDDVEDAFGLLTRGTFHLRSPREAELLSAHLGSAVGDSAKGAALFELLINAVEHGNLEISYSDKSRLLAEGRLAEEIRRRLERPEYASRRVEIHVEQGPRGFEVLIRDEGPGFTPERYFTVDESRLFDSHGRGIVFANAALDLEYLGRGNEVRVTIN
jgi:DNA-binding response OmpR family regulator